MSKAVDRFGTAAAGTADACFPIAPIAPSELARLAGASVADIATGAMSGRAAS